MEFDIPLGTSNTLKHTVGREDTAAAVASGLAEVFATPKMIGLMERTAMSSVQRFLPQGYSTVGTAIEAFHSAATPIGMEVSATSTLVTVERRKLVFEIVARDEAEEIGRARHTRFIVDDEKFLDKAYAKLK